MKRIYILLIAAASFFGCTKSDVDLIFDSLPEERINVRLTELQNKLLESPSGWKASLTTNASGGYGFYFNFKEDQTVAMVSDINATTARVISNSTYRVKWVMNASLIFDTYNYISLLQDPTAGTVPGGAQGSGVRSDIEFEYLRATADSIILRGKKYQNELVLVKASVDESDKYNNGEYQTSINKINNFFTVNANPYIEVAGVRTSVEINRTAKTASLTGIVDGAAKSASSKFYYTLSGINFREGISFSGVDIKSLTFKGDILHAVDKEGKEYEVKNSVSPILPLHMLMGVKYAGLRSPTLTNTSSSVTYFPGTAGTGLTILRRYFDGLPNRNANGVAVFGYGYMDLAWNTANKRVTLIGVAGQYQTSGLATWTTTIVYDYTVDESTGEYKFTLRTAASGGYSAAIMDQLNTFLTTSRFKLDYHVEGANLYGKIIGIDSPNVQMSFQLR
jgi:hypothetical protein